MCLDLIAEGTPMMRQHHRTGIGAFAGLLLFGALSHAWAADNERFEISSLKAVRPSLVATIAALRQSDISRARAAFDSYDSGWNGIEVYVNVRNKDVYRVLELEFQPKIIKALQAPSPNIPAVLADAEAMLARFDDAVSAFEKAAPLDPIYDEVARLRIVRAHLREVAPALKARDVAKARTSFEAFEDAWFNVEDFVRERSLDAYVVIETGMVEIENALLTPEKPDIAAVSALVGNVMTQYSSIIAELQKEERSRQ
jgi:hypothetical protein